MPPEVVGLHGEDIVALRVTSANGARVAATLRAGDIVVLDRQWSGLRAESVYAVRLAGGLVLSRCLNKGDSLLMLFEGPSAPGAPSDVDVLPLRDADELRRLIAGRVVVSLRVWR